MAKVTITIEDMDTGVDVRFAAKTPNTSPKPPRLKTRLRKIWQW